MSGGWDESRQNREIHSDGESRWFYDPFGKEVIDSDWVSPSANGHQPLQGDPEPPERPSGPRPEWARTTPPQPAADLFKRWTTRQLVDADRSFRWLVRGLWVDPTYGMISGAKKTLKSYVGSALDLAIAAGVPLFGRFEVDEARPVVAYVGEGGRLPYTRRLERLATAMGVKLGDVPLVSCFDLAPIGSSVFAESLHRDLASFDEPGLFHVDPFYAYHGAKVNSSNLHEEGALLTSLSTPCIDAGWSLVVANHFNKTGSGTGLDRITQSGGGEWSDSWILLSHRETPDVAGGTFRLLLEVGSRQWGGASWDLDFSLGRFNVELGDFDGDISWELRRHQGDDDINTDTERILALVSTHPFEFTKNEVVGKVGGNAFRMRQTVDDLTANGTVEARKIQRPRSDGRPYSVTALGPPSEGGTNIAETDAKKCEVAVQGTFRPPSEGGTDIANTPQDGRTFNVRPSEVISKGTDLH